MNGEQLKIIVLHLQIVPKDIDGIWVQFRQKTEILYFMQDLEKNGPLFATQYLQLSLIVHKAIENRYDIIQRPSGS